MQVDSTFFGVLSAVFLAGTIYTNASDALYFCIRIFFHSILSIFFKSIDVVGLDNIPQDGPVMFTGNHMNQFVDGIIVMMNCIRKVGFLVAEKSFKRAIIGPISKSLGCIPVVRPQDAVSRGTGTIAIDSSDSVRLIGKDTIFTKQMEPGDRVRIEGKSVMESGSPVKVLEIIDDTHAILSNTLTKVDGTTLKANEYVVYGIFKKVDQSEMFSAVYSHLKKGNCIGIFPEGGSHDRTDLLPLKAGVALMAFGVRQKHDISVPVVPVGLTYFRGHRFRARVVIEFGTPIHVTDEMMDTYEKDKRQACDEFLTYVEDGMRAVLVTAPDYATLQLIYAARRLYQRSGVRLSPRETNDLNRRFAEGYKLLMQQAAAAKEDSTLVDPTEDLAILRQKLANYSKVLRDMGLKDHQVPFIQWWSIHDVVSSAIYGFFIFLLASIPVFFLNAPVGLMARYVAKQEQKKALAGSKVKITGRDVMLSKKITFSLVGVPVLWISYLILAICCTNWYWNSIGILFWCFPLFSFFGVRAVEAGVIEFKTIQPLFYRLLPKYRKLQDQLPARRVILQHDVRLFIQKYQNILGDLAQVKRMDWTAYMHHQHTSSIRSSEENVKKMQ